MQFNEQNFNTYQDYGPKGISGWLINKGIAKDQKGANKVLLIALVLVIGATLLVINLDNFGGQGEVLTPEELGLPADDPIFVE